MPLQRLGILLTVLAGRLLAVDATLFPTVATLPFHLTNHSIEVAHTSGSGTAFVNFSAFYPDSLEGSKVLLQDDQGDSLLMRLDLDSALNIKSTILDTPAIVTMGFNFDHVRHATSFYLSASAFTVLENFVDSTVLVFQAFFSNNGADTVFVDSLRLSEDIRNARFFSSNGSNTPVAVPSNPNVRSLTAPGSTTSMDLMRIPLDSAFIRFGLDSVRFTVPRLRKVFITPGGVISIDGGVRVYGLSVATKYAMNTTHFAQTSSAWADSLLNGIAEVKMSIYGCAVTTSAMLLRAMNIKAIDGTDLTPLKFLQWLNANNGFKGSSADLSWPAIANFSQASFTANGSIQPRLEFRGMSKSADSVEAYLSNGIPVITRANSRYQNPSLHFVLSKGIGIAVDTSGPDSLVGTYLIEDGGYFKPNLMSFFTEGEPVSSSTNHPNRFISAQLFTVSKNGHPNYGWLQINVHSPAELIVSDPLGRRVGFDPINNLNYNEIPAAQYTLEGGIEDLANGTQELSEVKTIYIREPVAGNYKVKVIGTGTGSYEVTMSKSNRLGSTITEMPSIPGSTFPGKIDSGIVTIPTTTIPTWKIKFNGIEDSLAISLGDTLDVTVDIHPGANAGQTVDIRLLVKNDVGQTYYLTLPSTWGTQNVPTYSGLLPDVTDYAVTSIDTQAVPAGLYTFFFEVDYDNDGIAEQAHSAKVLIE